MVPCQLGSEQQEILQTPPSLVAETRRTDLTKNLCRLREKCDNGAYAGCNARPVQVVNKRVLVISGKLTGYCLIATHCWLAG